MSSELLEPVKTNREDLLEAVKTKNIKALEALLEKQDIDINYLHEPKKATPFGKANVLHLAAVTGDKEATARLIQHSEIKPEITTSLSQSTALHLAALNGHFEVCQLLLPTISSCVRDKENKLPYTVAKEKADKVTTSYEKNKYRKTLEFLSTITLIEACELGDLKTISELVADDMTPCSHIKEIMGLQYPMWLKRLEKFSALLISENEANFLHLAAVKSEKEIIKKLLTGNLKINWNEKTGSGNTALHLAVINAHLETCELLLEKVDPYIINNEHKLPYELAKENLLEEITTLLSVPTFVRACEKGDLELVKTLVNCGVNLKGTFNNLTGLMAACWAEKCEVFDYLISSSISDVNEINGLGDTVLHIMCIPRGSENHNKEDCNLSNIKLEIMRRLIGQGAKVNLRNNRGHTPLSKAVTYNVSNAAQLLVEKGADLKMLYTLKDGSKLDLVQLTEGVREEIHLYFKSICQNEEQRMTLQS